MKNSIENFNKGDVVSVLIFENKKENIFTGTIISIFKEHKAIRLVDQELQDGFKDIYIEDIKKYEFHYNKYDNWNNKSK